jgi:hypothetical protein
MRKLAVCALREEFAEQIDKAITIGGEYGFEVSWQALNRLTEQIDVQSLEPEKQTKLCKNILEHRSEMASELKQYSLPQTNRYPILTEKIAENRAGCYLTMLAKNDTRSAISTSARTVNLQ